MDCLVVDAPEAASSHVLERAQGLCDPVQVLVERMIVGQGKHVDACVDRRLEVVLGSVKARIAGVRPGRIDGELEIGEAQGIAQQDRAQRGVDIAVVRGKIIGRVDHDVPEEAEVQPPGFALHPLSDGDEQEDGGDYR
jgi:hypothetical protein